MSLKNLLFISLVLTTIAISSVHCGCDDDTKEGKSSEETGEVKQFFKNVGCSIQKGAVKAGETISEGAKKFGEGAKKLGQNIKEKFNEYKDRLTSDDEITTKTPLAPLGDGQLYQNVPLAPIKETRDETNNNFDVRAQV